MKRLSYLVMLAVVLTFAACKDAHKTGGATQDSSASHGYSGPAHPEKTEMGTGTAAGTSGTSDTSKRDTNKNQPSDSAKRGIR